MSSVLQPLGPNASSCGYCNSTTPTSNSFGAWAHRLTCADYQSLIDKGWRRSGMYLYKPDLQTTCCPAYAIRVSSKAFKVSGSQKKCVQKLNSFIRDGSKKLNTAPLNSRNALETLLEASSVDPDRFKIVTTPAAYDKELYTLYVKYQTTIHNDLPSDLTPKKYKNFLVDSPLIPYKENNVTYGSFHQKYYLNNCLIACGYIDVLPLCVSSVYFIYDPEYSHFSLGTFSALQEINYTMSISKNAPRLEYYYLGLYIHSCAKMQYKRNYKPSFLLCPESMDWIDADECAKKLDREKVCVLSDDTTFRTVLTVPTLPNDSDLDGLHVFDKGDLVMYNVYEKENKGVDVDVLKKLYSLVGEEMMQNTIIVLQ